MQVAITGIGVWADSAANWSEFCAPQMAQAAEARPLPGGELIPKAERRRAPKTAKLAVEVAQQACQMAGADSSNIASVFTSVLADSDLSDQICRGLALPQKLMSPTKFHNSVQNAPAGYWAIGAGNHAPCTYIGGFLESWSLALLEAAAQCLTEQRPVLLAGYDIINRPPMSDVCSIAANFGCALLLEPNTAAEPTARLNIAIGAKRGNSSKNIGPELQPLLLLNAIRRLNETGGSETQHWPLSSDTHLTICVSG
jgi:hypothetical protein